MFSDQHHLTKLKGRNPGVLSPLISHARLCQISTWSYGESGNI